jgi:Mimiviridae putative ATP-dependent RNA helicase
MTIADGNKKKTVRKTKAIATKSKAKPKAKAAPKPKTTAKSKTKARSKVAIKPKTKAVSKTKSKAKAKSKSKAKTGVKKNVTKTAKHTKSKSKVSNRPGTKSKGKVVRATDLLDAIGNDIPEDIDGVVDEFEEDMVADSELSESDSESEEEIESESDTEEIEYEMDEYESNQAGSKRHILLKKVLLNTFGYRSFKPEQYKIIDQILDGMDVLGVMPTGYGKSLCFQLPPLVTNEISIVISPLIALMADQQESMAKLGVSSGVYNSTIGMKRKKELEEELVAGKHRILYVTPESLDKPAFRTLIDRIYTEVGICMVAVDEAHCVSAYGFDFRPKYREIAKVRKYLPDIPVLAITATATTKVSKDIMRNLDMQSATHIQTSFDRPNIFINIKQVRQNTLEKICELIKASRAKKGSAIIYCVTKRDTDKINRQLKTKGIKSVAYHADMTKDKRTLSQDKFMNGKVDCICATVAFGMGINKANVRLVVHYGCPKNIESYYQEIGRAGRDGKDAECWLFYRQGDFRIQQLFIEKIQDPIYKTTSKRLLYIMTKYVTDKKCRRKELLKYFSEEYKLKNCGKCDNCCSVTKAINRKDEGDLFKLLSTLFELEAECGYSVGKNKLILIMKGSNSKGISTTMKGLPYYGNFSAKKKADVTTLLETAIELGYIENTHARPGDTFMVLKCTEYGLAFGQEYEKKLNKISRKKEAGTTRIRIV